MLRRFKIKAHDLIDNFLGVPFNLTLLKNSIIIVHNMILFNVWFRLQPLQTEVFVLMLFIL